MAADDVTSDHLQILAIAVAAAAGAGCLGLAAAWLVRRRSVRWAFLLVALVAVVGMVTGVVATARAMFISEHDYEVVLWVAVSAGVVSLGFAWLAAQIPVRGAYAVQQATRRAGAGGEFVAPVDTMAELRELSSELERTLDRLREAHERERSLEAARRELVAWMSHDLRTPLAGLRAMAEALEDDMATDRARYHRQINVQRAATLEAS